MLCNHCNEGHPIRHTKDNNGPTGEFCPSIKKMTKVYTDTWNGLCVPKLLRQFIPMNVDMNGLDRLTDDKITKLSRRVAYQFRETTICRKHSVSYYFVQYYAERLLFEYRDQMTL